MPATLVERSDTLLLDRTELSIGVRRSRMEPLSRAAPAECLRPLQPVDPVTRAALSDAHIASAFFLHLCRRRGEFRYRIPALLSVCFTSCRELYTHSHR